MKTLLTGLVLTGLVTVLVMGQGYDVVPEDAIVIGIGEPGTGYEGLEIGTKGGRFATELVIGVQTWNPVVGSDGGTHLVTGEMHRGLVAIDPMTGVFIPELAKSWTVSEDGLAITFALRKGLRWSDGAPFTVDDVLFTYNDLLLNDAVHAHRRDALRLPDGTFPVIERVDDYNVLVTLSTAFRPIFDALTASILPRHALAAYVHKVNPRALAGTFNETWGLDTPPTELVGLGPFLLAEFRQDEFARLVPNPYYYHYDPHGMKLPYLDELVFDFVVSKDLALLKFLNGELDMIAAQVADIGILLAEASIRGYSVGVGGEPYGTGFFTFNFDAADPKLRVLFRQLAFRQAMAHAVDKQASLDRNLGIGDMLWSPISMASPYYAGRDSYGGPITEADAVWHEYDLAEAAELLDTCGILDRDGDGVREFGDGSPVEFELVTVAGYELAERYVLAMAAELSHLGIQAHVNLVAFGRLVEMIGTGLWEAMAISMTGGHDPHEAINVLRSTGRLHFWHRSALAGDVLPYEQEIDRLMDLGAGIYDPDEAFEIYKQVQLLFARKDLGMIFGIQSRQVIPVYDDIGNGTAIRSKAAPYETVYDLLFIKPRA